MNQSTKLNLVGEKCTTYYEKFYILLAADSELRYNESTDKIKKLEGEQSKTLLYKGNANTLCYHRLSTPED